MLLHPLLTVALLPVLALAKKHHVDVGNKFDSFTPDTLTAEVGDEIVFQFFPGGDHGVASSAYNAPCQPGGTPAIWSGFQDNRKTWTVTVKDKNPIWIYCPQITHCPFQGMSIGINAGAGETLADYQKRARQSHSKRPKKVQGGVLSSGPT